MEVRALGNGERTDRVALDEHAPRTLEVDEGTDLRGEETAPDRPTQRHRRARSLAGMLAGLAVMVTLFYFMSSRAWAADSDGATAVLEGQAMAAGHLTLHGWALSLDSFWSVDALFDTVGVLMFGVRSMLLQLIPAVIAGLVVLMGALIAQEGRTGRARFAAIATVVVFLGLPSVYFSFFFLRGPYHVGTTLWCLVAFFALRRGRLGAGWFVAVAFMAAGMLGDLQMVGLGVAAVFGAGVVAMLRLRDWRAGAPLVGASVASVVLAIAVRSLAVLLGTFTIGKVNKSATVSQSLTNIVHLPATFARMMGVGFHNGVNPVGPLALVPAHFIALVVVVVAIITYSLRLVAGAVRGTTDIGRHSRRSDQIDAWRLDDLLLLGCLCGMFVFVKLATSGAHGYERYLTSAVVFGCILAGRFVGNWVSTVRSARLLRNGAIVGLVTTLAIATGFGIALSHSTAVPPASRLGKFLEEHRLYEGIGDYWCSSITTVVTDGEVTVRPVFANVAGKVVRYQRQSNAAWYQGQNFEFLVYRVKGTDGVNRVVAVGTFGAPVHTYDVGIYRVLVWAHPLSVSSNGFDPG